MTADTERIDGAAIARERIAREAVERTGTLDLEMLMARLGGNGNTERVLRRFKWIGKDLRGERR
jgi:hypothetical protein